LLLLHPPTHPWLECSLGTHQHQLPSSREAGQSVADVLFACIVFAARYAAGHEINFVWASHAVHHSSEHYNLTTSLRQSAVQSCFSFAFFLPMAFFLPVDVYLTLLQWNTLYQVGWVGLRRVCRGSCVELVQQRVTCEL